MSKEELLKKGFVDISNQNHSEVWKYFYKNKILQKAACLLCTTNPLSIKGSCTHGLIRHLKLHNIYVSSTKNYKCNICDKFCSTKFYLNKHIKMIHKSLKSFQCDLCDKAFSKLFTLKRHIGSVHKGLKNNK